MSKLKIRPRGISDVARANLYGKIVRHINDVGTKSGQREILVNLVGEFLKHHVGGDIEAEAKEFFRDVIQTMGLRDEVEGQRPKVS